MWSRATSALISAAGWDHEDRFQGVAADPEGGEADVGPGVVGAGCGEVPSEGPAEGLARLCAARIFPFVPVCPPLSGARGVLMGRLSVESMATVHSPGPPHRRGPGRDAASPRSRPVPSGRSARSRSARVRTARADHARSPGRSMIGVLVHGLSRGVRHETAQPVGGCSRQASAQRVDPDHRPVDSCFPKTTRPRTHLRLVRSLNDHFPLSRVRRGASSEPLPRVLLPPPSFPLSWHLPRIIGRRQGGKAIGSNTHTLGNHL